MSCYHPLKGFPIGLTENGKTKYKVTSYECTHVYSRLGSDKWLAESGIPFKSHDRKIVEDFIEIPCGQCLGCRLQYSREWANRCMLELEYHDSAYFVTLTYDDDNVPRSFYSDPETGEAFESLTLVKRDFQLFMKRLRKRFGEDKIRFFMSGEYGSTTFRPHYHAIIFGLHLDDLTEFANSNLGHKYYNSQSLSECWQKGYAVVAPVTWETCAYTARYVMKKLKGSEAVFYENFNLQPEFTLMSRKPGIAYQWYREHPDVYDFDYINLATEKGGLKFKPPKYYDRLFDVENPEKSAEVKAIRKKMAIEIQKAKLQRTDLDYTQMLEVEERNKAAKIKCLERSL